MRALLSRQSLPSGFCELSTSGSSVTPKPQIGEDAQIPAGGSVDVLFYAGPEPSTAPLGQVTLYYCRPGEGQTGITRWNCVQIPLPK